MKRLLWALRQLVLRLGVPGVVAALMGLAGVLVWFADVGPKHARIEALEHDNAQLQRHAARRLAPVAVLTPTQQLQAFKQRFGDERSIAPALARIQAAALRHGLRLEHAEFKLLTQDDESIGRYTMDWPVKADYRALRRFAAEVLREQPALALESISLQRAEAGASIVDARLRLVLFLSRAG